MSRILLLSLAFLGSSAGADTWVELSNEIFAGDSANRVEYQSAAPFAGKASAVRIERSGEGCARAIVDIDFIGSDPDSGAPVALRDLFRQGKGGVDEYTLYPSARILGLRYRIHRAGSCYFTFSLKESVG